jgi:hypothetical protein
MVDSAQKGRGSKLHCHRRTQGETFHDRYRRRRLQPTTCYRVSGFVQPMLSRLSTGHLNLARRSASGKLCDVKLHPQTCPCNSGNQSNPVAGNLAPGNNVADPESPPLRRLPRAGVFFRDRIVCPPPPSIVDSAPRVTDRPVQSADLPGNLTQIALRKLRTLQQLQLNHADSTNVTSQLSAVTLANSHQFVNKFRGPMRCQIQPFQHASSTDSHHPLQPSPARSLFTQLVIVGAGARLITAAMKDPQSVRAE